MFKIILSMLNIKINNSCFYFLRFEINDTSSFYSYSYQSFSPFYTVYESIPFFAHFIKA